MGLAEENTWVGKRLAEDGMLQLRGIFDGMCGGDEIGGEKAPSLLI